MTTETNNKAGAETGAQRPIDPNLLMLRYEIRTYRRELPRLLAEGQEGRFVLIKGDQVLSLWDTFDDALQAGYERFGLGVVFLTHRVDSRDLTHVFPQELDPARKD